MSAVALVAASLAGCGTQASFDAHPIPHVVATTTSSPPSTLPSSERASRKRPTPRVTTPPVTPVSGDYDIACGGDLPPCFVMNRESGGNLRIWNGRCYAPVGWTGAHSPCGGSSASGKWQFLRSTWNRFKGYLNAADAPADAQNEKARLLWAGGRGCSHWNACAGGGGKGHAW